MRGLNEQINHTNGESGIIENKIKLKRDQKVHQKYKFDNQIEDLKKQLETERKKAALAEASYTSFLNQVDLIRKRINLQSSNQDDNSDDFSPVRSPIRNKTSKKTMKSDTSPMRNTIRLIPENEEMNVIKVEKGANPSKKKGKKKKVTKAAGGNSKKENKEIKEKGGEEKKEEEKEAGGSLEKKANVERGRSAESKRGVPKGKGETDAKKSAGEDEKNSLEKKPLNKKDDLKEVKEKGKK